MCQKESDRLCGLAHVLPGSLVLAFPFCYLALPSSLLDLAALPLWQESLIKCAHSRFKHSESSELYSGQWWKVRVEWGLSPSETSGIHMKGKLMLSD